MSELVTVMSDPEEIQKKARTDYFAKFSHCRYKNSGELPKLNILLHGDGMRDRTVVARPYVLNPVVNVDPLAPC